jgi:hypothetical protein
MQTSPDLLQQLGQEKTERHLPHSGLRRLANDRADAREPLLGSTVPFDAPPRPIGVVVLVGIPLIPGVCLR